MTFRKSDPQAAADFFAHEAAGLAWLAAANGAPVVSVLASGRTYIELPELSPTTATARQAREFGAALARTHDAGAPAFGHSPLPGTDWSFIGSQPMPTTPAPSWGRFYADQRVWHFAQRAHQVGGLTSSGREVIAAVCEQLRAGDYNDEAPPARIHGDLWAGNIVWTKDGGVLIDPAAHGGHRITDLAMLSLFGAPHLEQILAGYEQNSTQLPHGWRDLIGLHQLHPLLVHTVTHSPHYGTQAAEIATRYVT